MDVSTGCEFQNEVDTLQKLAMWLIFCEADYKYAILYYWPFKEGTSVVVLSDCPDQCEYHRNTSMPP